MLLIAACGSATTSDLGRSTEKFLEGKEVEQKTNLKFTDAACETPSATSVGTTYGCLATGADGNFYRFTVRVTEKNKFTVVDFSPMTNAGATTTTPKTATDTTAGSPGYG